MNTIEAEPIEQSLTVRHHQEVGQALTASQITERLHFIKKVMQDNMTEGVDYGKVPGCGDKPGLFQPGAQKLSMTFQLNPEVHKEEVTDYLNFHRGYRLTVRVTNGSKFADGVGECSTLEGKYRYRSAGRKCPKCGRETIIKGKQEYGGGWLCFAKKGGCGEKFVEGSELGQQIAGQSEGKTEHDNPPDHWNTVRKMAFKRGLVHAIINATNTSELWSQDLEDLHSNGVAPQEALGASQKDTRIASEPPKPKNTVRTEADATARTAKSETKAATAATRQWLLDVLAGNPGQPNAKLLQEFCVKAAILLVSETVLDIPLRYVPTSKAQLKLWEAAFNGFCDGREARKPFTNDEPPPEKKAKEEKQPDLKPQDGWRTFPVPFGRNAGVQLGKLTKNSLSFYVREFKVETHFEGRNGQPIQKKPESLAKDKAFRAALDQAKAELGGMEGEA